MYSCSTEFFINFIKKQYSQLTVFLPFSSLLTPPESLFSLNLNTGLAGEGSNSDWVQETRNDDSQIAKIRNNQKK